MSCVQILPVCYYDIQWKSFTGCYEITYLHFNLKIVFDTFFFHGIFFLNFFILMFANAVMGLSSDVPHIYIGAFISGHFI